MNKNNDMIPVTLVKGFLEAGKSTLINHLLDEENLCTGETLLISCEEGEISFDTDILSRNQVILVELEEESQLTRNHLGHLSEQYRPSQIVIECNAMWKMIEFELPKDWKITKRIAVLSALTLDLYLDNMRAYLGPMLSRCDQIFINRCDPDPDMLIPSKAKLRPLLGDISTVTIESQGKYYGFDSIQDQIPYSLSEDIITISQRNYVFWFYDCQDNRSRYEGRKVSLNGSIKKSPVLGQGKFALGEIAITCCEADMSFLGFIAHYDQIDSFSQLAHVHAEAVVHYRFIKSYQAVMPYLEITHMELCAPENRIATF